MGVCDLIPGVSGGTIAYITGIYRDFLSAIQSLNLNLKNVHWRFILPVVSGVAASVLLFSRLFYFLLTHYELLLFAFFFGVIATSSVSSIRKGTIQWLTLALGFLFSFILCGLPHISSEPTLFWLFFCGMLGSAAMLLPGISGSFMLHILGVYTLFIQALANFNLSFLIVVGLGIAAGFVLFSRVASRLLDRYPNGTHFFLTGCMLGGLRSLWPYTMHNIASASLLIVLGALLTFWLERKGKVALLPSNS